MLSHPLTSFEIQKHYQNELKFNGFYSRNDLPKTKDRAHAINLDEFKSVRTHWIALYVNENNVAYFDSFGVEHIPKEIKKINRQQKYHNILQNIYRFQANDPPMYGYFCIGFINSMLKGKSFLDYTNFFSPKEYEKNNKIILKYFY